MDYIVTLTVNKASACQEHIQKKIRYEVNEGEIVYAPNSFTPNGDGLNDRFELKLWKPCDIYKLTILDRWGHLVYQNDDANTSSWDGMAAENRYRKEFMFFCWKDPA
jgi:gliding motility-associated-like protein